MEYFEEAISIDEQFAGAYVNWGQMHLRKREYDDAIVKYREAAARDSDAAEAYNGWGVALLLSDEVHASIDKFDKALELAPKYISRYRYLDATFRNRGHQKEVEEFARKIRELLHTEKVATEADERVRPPVQVKHIPVPCEKRNLRLYGVVTSPGRQYDA